MATHSICNGICVNLPCELRHQSGENIYIKNAYCRHCKKFFLKSLLPEGKKARCPCCNGQARVGPSSSARNKTRKNRERMLIGN